MYIYLLVYLPLYIYLVVGFIYVVYLPIGLTIGGSHLSRHFYLMQFSGCPEGTVPAWRGTTVDGQDGRSEGGFAGRPLGGNGFFPWESNGNKFPNATFVPGNSQPF